MLDPQAQAKIEALIAFLPLLYSQNFQPVIRWQREKVGVRDGKEIFRNTTPEYHSLVEDFTTAARDFCHYDIAGSFKSIGGMEEQIQRFEEIRRNLLLFVKKEEFSPGLRENMIRGEFIRSDLESLRDIFQEITTSHELSGKFRFTRIIRNTVVQYGIRRSIRLFVFRGISHFRGLWRNIWN
ncbi:MAG: hypothetical protein LBU79_05275 [Planctomycetota bacterium]|jgi:hypothetical protein|nr:hypothetical protein [Planctomycetota bacterium]